MKKILEEYYENGKLNYFKVYTLNYFDEKVEEYYFEFNTGVLQKRTYDLKIRVSE